MFPQIFGKYVLEREMAAGGMARVYLATLRGAVGFEKRLVVKQIRAELANDEAFVRRFVEEAKTSVELSHPNIVPVYELGVERGVYYIAMELCEGTTLAEVLAETGPLAPEEGAYLGVEICRALDYAHRRAGVVHRDVTPRNVLIDEEGAARLIDFGIAAPVSRDATGRQEIFGSPGHMPPEQLRGEPLTPATDVFAMGALLVEAWTGQPPFRRNTPEKSEQALAVGYARVENTIPKLSGLGDLLAAALSPDPATRPASAEQLARPLREFLKSSDLGEVARRVGARVRKARRHGSSSSPWPEEGSAGMPARTPRAASGTPDSRTPTAPPALDAGESAAPPANEVIATRTFAARDDLVVWTRKLPSVPPAGPAEGRRPQTGPSGPADSRRPSASSDPDAASQKNPSQLVESARSGPTPAKQRHDEDTSPTTTQRSAPDPARAASNYRLIAAVLAGMVIAGVISTRLAGRSVGGPASSGPVSESVAPPVAHVEPMRPVGLASLEGATSPPAKSVEVERAPPIASIPAKPGKTAGVGAGSAKPAASSGSSEQCRILLIGNLDAAAAVDGRQVPLRTEQRMPCGFHKVTFRSAALRESADSSVTLVPGRTQKVIVDFSGVRPEVRTQ